MFSFYGKSGKRIFFLFGSNEYFLFSVCCLIKLCIAKEAECKEQWSLDNELAGDEDIPDVLKSLTEKTFKNYTIDIKSCDDDVSYEYVLDKQYIWDLRYVIVCFD